MLRGGIHRGRHRIGAAFLFRAIFLACIAATAVIAGRAESEFQAEQIIDVPAGGSLQQALNAVQPGGTIRLAAGATYVGPFTLPAKGGASYITITTGGANLPPAGTRITPAYKPGLATIRSSTTSAAIVTAAGASYYRIVGIAFEANQNGSGDIIALGRDSQTTASAVPHHLELDRVLVAGHPTIGQKRAISVNASYVTIANSDIRDIKAAGQDSQAICGWNTNGPITIRNNYLEAAGENIMFGGAHINLSGAVPSDILVEDNTLTKNPAWRGSAWTVKNLLELKNARRVVVRRNALQFNWAAAQPGFAVVLTPRNSSQATPWVVVEDIEFSGNIVSHVSSVFNLLGHDDTAPSRQLARVLIKNNLFYDVDGDTWGGSGLLAQIGGEPAVITFDHNTVMHTGNVITFYSGTYVAANGARVTGGPILGFRFTNNLMKHNTYGIFGSGQAYGSGTLNYYTPNAEFRRNVLATDRALASRYPPDNEFPPLASFTAAFYNAAAHDFRLVPGASSYLLSGTDGRDLGVDFAAIPAAAVPSAPAGLRIRQP